MPDEFASNRHSLVTAFRTADASSERPQVGSLGRCELAVLRAHPVRAQLVLLPVVRAAVSSISAQSKIEHALVDTLITETLLHSRNAECKRVCLDSRRVEREHSRGLLSRTGPCTVLLERTGGAHLYQRRKANRQRRSFG